MAFRKLMKFLNFRIASALLVIVLAVMPAGGGKAAAQLGLLSPGPASFAPLVRKIADVVVGIAVTEAPGTLARPPTPLLPRPESGKPIRPKLPPTEAAGSGFIVSDDGMIVTNDHVIAGAASIVVTLDDGERYPARLVGADDLTDLAVIRITPRHRLHAARWGDSGAVQVGDWVLAAGNPFALGNSFTAGIVSAEGRDIGDGPFDHFLQLDAPINPGNSGGAAFDMDGEVVGVNTAIVSPSGGSVGIGFAIPSNNARKIVAALIAHGNVARGWLGISVADAPAAAPAANGTGAAGSGAAVTGVVADGPGDHAGLATGDVVLTVNGADIAGSAQLIRAIASLQPGTKVSLGISRNGHILTLPVVVDRRPERVGE